MTQVNKLSEVGLNMVRKLSMRDNVTHTVYTLGLGRYRNINGFLNNILV